LDSITFELSPEMLESVLQRVFKVPSATPVKFSIKALKPGAGNPTSLGVYRVWGTAQLESQVLPFTVVVKHLANGLPYMDASAPTHWNYWRREMEFFESPLVERIPASIGFPEYLGQTTLNDGSALFWNTDLGDLNKSKWTWEHCIDAVKLVAELNSVDSSDLLQFDWLNRSQVAGWAKLHKDWDSFDSVYPELLASVLRNPHLGEAFNHVNSYLNSYDFIGGLLAAGQRSFVHGDFNLNNLVPVDNQEVRLTALDWQLAGEARLGTEVAAIFNTAVEHGVCAADRESFDWLCLAYTQRFNELNPLNQVELNDVRLAAAAMGYFIVVNMGFFFAKLTQHESKEERNAYIDGFVESLTAGVAVLYAKVIAQLT